MHEYVGQPELNATCFDDKGYYLIGDAEKFIDPDDLGRGLVFDARLPRISS